MIARVACVLVAASCLGFSVGDEEVYPLESPDELDAVNAELVAVEHRGRKGVRMLEVRQGVTDSLAILSGTDFQDGVIEVELTGKPRKGAAPNMRGFVGIAFRVQMGEAWQYECFYLRPTNARAEEQVRRNHTTQYVSHPEYPWHRLRREAPGKYESYVDIAPDEWTKVRIEVSGRKARLYLHGSKQPALIVNDLKGKMESGSLALWVGQGTEAHFRDLKIEHADS